MIASNEDKLSSNKTKLHISGVYYTTYCCIASIAGITCVCCQQFFISQRSACIKPLIP